MFNIIKRDILTLLRDKGSMFFIVIFPSLLVFLLGNMLAQMDDSDSAISPINLEYTAETTDFFDRMAIQTFTEALAENSAITMTNTEDWDAAKQAVETNALSAAVRFKEPFAVDIFEGYDAIQNRAVASMMYGFNRQTAAIRALSKDNPLKMFAATSLVDREYVEKKEFGYKRTMLDYYAVAMITMIIFMGSSIGGASNLYESRQDGTLHRLLAGPQNRVNLYIQTVLGAFPQCLIQVACVMFTSIVFFGAHYANTAADNVLLFAMFFLAGLTVNAVFLVLGLFIKVNPTLAIMPIMWTVMFISGTFSKEIYIKGVTELSPIWQIQNAAFDLTVFGRNEKCLMVIAVCAGVFIVATAIGALLFRRKSVVLV